MDTALLLRIKSEQSDFEADTETIQHLLQESDLINQLTSEFIRKPLFAIWRVIALSEIPYTNQLAYSREIVEYICKHLSTSSGFTLTGKETDLLPCYNAMIIESLSKLGYAEREEVKCGIEWIKKYQRFERNTPTIWKGKGIKKYGGCLEPTPCFLGIVKTVKALVYYQRATGNKDRDIDILIEKGMDYILMHNLFKRLSNEEPINKYILTLSFPASYQLNVIELLELAYFTGYTNHPSCKEAIEYVLSKQVQHNYWKSDYTYKASGYLTFDKKGKKGEWITYLLNRYIGKQD